MTTRTERKLIGLEKLQAKLGDPSRSTIDRMCKRGELPLPIKWGNRLLWDEDEIDAYIEEMMNRRGDAA
ncbi:MAG: transcriptional regulator [Pseudomonadota bacterium]